MKDSMEENKPNLEEMLSALQTEEGRAGVVLNLVGKANIPDEYILKAIEFYENRANNENEIKGLLTHHKNKIKNLINADEIAARAKMTDKHVELSEKLGNFVVAATLLKAKAEGAKEAGLTDVSNQSYIRALEDYKKGIRKEKWFKRSLANKMIELVEEVEIPQKAKIPYYKEVIRYYLKGGTANYDDAADLAERAGLEEDVKQIRLMQLEHSTSCGYFDIGAGYAKRLGMLDEAKRLYLKSYSRVLKNVERFGIINLTVDELVSNITCAEELGFLDEAKQACLKGIEYSEKENDFMPAVSFTEKLAELEVVPEEKAKLLTKVGYYRELAQVLKF
jgi:tetratricopeptide (TPR) repeat protein